MSITGAIYRGLAPTSDRLPRSPETLRLVLKAEGIELGQPSVVCNLYGPEVEVEAAMIGKQPVIRLSVQDESGESGAELSPGSMRRLSALGLLAADAAEELARSKGRDRRPPENLSEAPGVIVPRDLSELRGKLRTQEAGDLPSPEQEADEAAELALDWARDEWEGET